MMTKPIAVMALTTIAMVVVAASAQAQDGPQQSRRVTYVEITPFVSLGSNASSGVGAAVRWPLGSNFSLEVETAGRWSEVTALSIGASLLFDLPAIGQATPYVAAGIGLDQYGSPVELPGGAVATQARTAVTVNAGGESEYRRAATGACGPMRAGPMESARRHPSGGGSTTALHSDTATGESRNLALCDLLGGVLTDE